MSKSQNITWTNITVRLGDLKPWSDNPRQSTQAQAKKLLQSWDKFGQVETVAVSPDLDLYNGHQRLSALLTVYGADYMIEARQASRHLTEAEKRELTITLHAGATGSWDWESLSGWQPVELKEWGFDESLFRNWKTDAGALGNFLGAEQIDYSEEWQGMPEFEMIDDKYKSIIVHFENQESVDEFSELVQQNITENTKSLWYPEKEKANLKNLVFADES